MLIATPKTISQTTYVPFQVIKPGLYSLSIRARCVNKKQSSDGKNQTMRVEIDDNQFREIPPVNKPQYNKIPAAWSGTDTQGLPKTVTFVSFFDQGDHILKLIPNSESFVESINLELQDEKSQISLPINETAEDGNRRAWHTIALLSLPLKSLKADASVSWHFLDGDDLKIIIDNQIQSNSNQLLRKNWAWSSRPWHKISGPQRSQLEFNTSLEKGDHYIEFWADRTPTLHQVAISLNIKSDKRVPTVDDPLWTEDFFDDPDQIILARAIFGEGRDVKFSDELRIAIGWSIRNRVEDSRWPDTYAGVITQPEQYSAFNLNDPNRQLLENPLQTNLELDKTAWLRAYDIAGKVLNGQVADPTSGANHYHDSSTSRPYYLTEESLVLTITNSTRDHSVLFYKI